MQLNEELFHGLIQRLLNGEISIWFREFFIYDQMTLARFKTVITAIDPAQSATHVAFVQNNTHSLMTFITRALTHVERPDEAADFLLTRGVYIAPFGYHSAVALNPHATDEQLQEAYEVSVPAFHWLNIERLKKRGYDCTQQNGRAYEAMSRHSLLTQQYIPMTAGERFNARCAQRTKQDALEYGCHRVYDAADVFDFTAKEFRRYDCGRSFAHHQLIRGRLHELTTRRLQALGRDLALNVWAWAGPTYIPRSSYEIMTAGKKDQQIWRSRDHLLTFMKYYIPAIPIPFDRRIYADHIAYVTRVHARHGLTIHTGDNAPDKYPFVDQRHIAQNMRWWATVDKTAADVFALVVMLCDDFIALDGFLLLHIMVNCPRLHELCG